MLLDELAIGGCFRSGDPCATCGEPVVDMMRGLIHRRLLYHSQCWLKMMSAAPGPEPVIPNAATNLDSA